MNIKMSPRYIGVYPIIQVSRRGSILVLKDGKKDLNINIIHV